MGRVEPESPHGILAESERVKDLFRRSGEYQKALGDRPVLEGREQQARRQAGEVLKGLRPELDLEAIARMRPDITISKQPILQLAQRFQAVEATRRKAGRDLDSAQASVEALAAEVARDGEGVDAGPLAIALKDARRAGDLDQQLDQALADERRLAERCEAELGALGLWQGTLEAVASLPVPSVETAERYEKRFTQAEARSVDLDDERRKLEAQASEIGRAIEELRRGVAVPSEDDLERLRSRRQAGWKLVRQAWLDGSDVQQEAQALDPDRGLPDAYECLVGQADDVADRLRREADRVASHAQAMAERTRVAEREMALAAQGNEQAAASQALQSEWDAIWAPVGVRPLPPREMRAWLGKLRDLRDRVVKLADAEQRAADLKQVVSRHRAEISARLSDLGREPIASQHLGPLLDQGDAEVEAIKSSAARRRDLAQLRARLVEVQGEARRAEADVKQWQQEWAHVIRALSVDAPPVEVQAVLEAYDRVFTHLDEAAQHASRRTSIDRDCRAFEQEVRDFAERVAPDLWTGDAAACVVALESQLSCTQQEQGQRAARHHELQKELRELERNLIEQGDGCALEDLVQQVETANADEVPVEIDRIRQRMIDLEARRTAQSERKGAAQNELERMTGTDTAAALASEGQEVLARLRGQVETYLRLRAASALLAREIERYRATNQDPLLLRAGEIFRVLTLGGFEAVRSDVDDDDRPRLLGVRAGGTPVTVEGMSSGTRDQLYLALRLATLERFLDVAEPMPLIVDDILINFDDRRARATLGVLAEIARKTQVLVFTHHERVRQMGAEVGTAVEI
jgi:uncharacterized protein YhaN